jgi:hypothetical protein
MTLYIELRGRVCHIIVLNAHAPIKGKSEGSRVFSKGKLACTPSVP